MPGVLLLADWIGTLATMTVSDESLHPTNVAIASAVDQLREDRGLSVEQLAVYAGINRAQLYRKLKGTVGWKATDVAALARYFAVEPNDLFSGNPLPRPRRAGSRGSGGKGVVRHQGLEPRTR